MNAAVSLLVWFWAHALSPDPRDGDEPPGLQVSVNPAEVAPGEAFTLEVTRTWPRSCVPEQWDEGFLEPLHFTLHEEERTELADTIQERRAYRCRALQLDPVVLSEFSFRALSADGATEHQTRHPSLTIAVQPQLDPTAAGDVELPGDILEAGGRQGTASPWIVGLGAALVALALVAAWAIARRRARGRSTAPDPMERLRQRLSRLHERPPAEHEVPGFYGEAAELVRDYLGTAGIEAPHQRTTEQVLTTSEERTLFESDQHAALRDALGRCDRVKFARHAARGPDHEKLLEGLELLLGPSGGPS